MSIYIIYRYVLSRLVNLYIKCSDFGHQLTLMNVQMDMPIYVISYSVHQHFSNVM